MTIKYKFYFLLQLLTFFFEWPINFKFLNCFTEILILIILGVDFVVTFCGDWCYKVWSVQIVDSKHIGHAASKYPTIAVQI